MLGCRRDTLAPPTISGFLDAGVTSELAGGVPGCIRWVEPEGRSSTQAVGSRPRSEFHSGCACNVSKLHWRDASRQSDGAGAADGSATYAWCIGRARCASTTSCSAAGAGIRGPIALLAAARSSSGKTSPVTSSPTLVRHRDGAAQLGPNRSMRSPDCPPSDRPATPRYSTTPVGITG